MTNPSTILTAEVATIGSPPIAIIPATSTVQRKLV
jgi:hypothetical protein